jgi:hypothetical protein
MPNDNGLLNSELVKSLQQNLRLSLWCPGSVSRTSAMAKARPIKGKDLMTLSYCIEQAAGRNLLHHTAIAVNDHDGGLAAATPNIMQPNATDFDKPANRRILPFGPKGILIGCQRRAGQCYANLNCSPNSRHRWILLLPCPESPLSLAHVSQWSATSTNGWGSSL